MRVDCTWWIVKDNDWRYCSIVWQVYSVREKFSEQIHDQKLTWNLFLYVYIKYCLSGISLSGFDSNIIGVF
jgi:hypothetical protein